MSWQSRVGTSWAALGRWRQPLAATGWALTALVLGILLARGLPLDRWLDRRHDLQTAALAPAAPPSAAVVVDVDEDSLRRMGPWPLRRDAYVPAADWMLRQGARAVVFGMLLVDSREGDGEFTKWLVEPGRPVILGARSVQGEGQQRPVRGAPPGCGALRWPAWQLPLWARADAEPPRLPIDRVGALSAPLDDDGVLRRLPMWQQAGDLALPALPLATWMQLHPDQSSGLHCELTADGRTALVGAGFRWPLDAGYRMLPWLARPGDKQPALPLWLLDDAAAGRLPEAEAATLAAQLRGRVVVIGSTAALGDQVLTAQGPRSGARVLAASYDAIAAGQLLLPPRPAGDALLLLVGLLPWLVTLRSRLVHQRARPRATLLAVALAGALLIAVDTLLVAQRGQLSQVGAPLAMLVLMAAAEVWRWQRQTMAEQRRLRLARAEMAAASQVKSDFLAHVSHEIRTPLNALLGAAELLAQSRLDLSQQRHVKLFTSAGQELMQMLGDLLDLSKLEVGLLTLRREPFSLADLVARQVLLFEARAQQKGLALNVRTDPDLPDAVVGDAQRLAQVLRNLLSNAVKFTSAGHVTLTIGFSKDRQRIRFEVQDTGVGIPSDRVEAVFAPYVQADDSVTPRYGGTGLGLTISRQLVEAMGGRIGLSSRESLGSVFHVELPLPATDVATAEPDSDAADRLHSTMPPPLAEQAADGLHAHHRLLVADDSAHNLVLAQAYLEGQGFAVDTAHDGSVAMRLFERTDYSVVLLDLNMPVLDGLATARAMRADEQRRRRRPALIIAQSGQIETADVQAAKAAGFDEHIGKPFSRSQLLALLARRGAIAPPTDTEATTVGGWTSQPGESRLSALSALPDSDLPAAMERIGSESLYDQVLDLATEPLMNFEHELALSLDGMPCDLDRAQRLVHNLKSTAANLGLSGLAAEARLLAQALALTVSPSEDAQLWQARVAVSQRLQGVKRALG